MEKRPFREIGLSAEVLKAVDRLGFEEASPIQSLAIPLALTGRDLVGQSATGSGKTAAFGIPAIEKVDTHSRRVQCLVLCPTRELAVQVAEEIGRLAHFKRGVHAVPIYGGQSIERQIRALRAGTQIVIGTPGRVMDHLDRRTLDLSAVKLVVLDETDRMLDMGFRDDIETILRGAPAERQMMFFSATMPREIRRLIDTYSRDPEFVHVEAREQNAPQVEQVYYEVERRSKLEVLCRLIDLHDFKCGIIFCSTKIMVDALADDLLARGYSADRLHGDMSQAAREKTLGRFRAKKVEMLVATDVAGRGLDVDDVEVVFNFDLPNDAEDYVHRIGRTARAGRKGQAITFVSGRDIYRMQNIIRSTRMKVRRERVPSLDQVEEKRESAFFERLRATLDSGEFKKHDRTIDRLLEQGYASTDIASALVHLQIGGETREEVMQEPPEPTRPERPARRRKLADGEPQSRSRRGPEDGDRFPEMERRPVRFNPERPHEPGMKRLYLNIGHMSQITPGNIVGAIAGVTGLPGKVVGAIDIFTKHSFVDVAGNHAEDIVAKLQGVRMKGRYVDAAIVPEDT